jgi:hypothetical protein
MFACVALMVATAGQVQAALINGDFQTGDLTGWTTFTTGNGTIGTPTVVSFDTAGTGASLASRFSVGQVINSGSQQGGGIFQSVVVSTPGIYDLYVDIAVARLNSSNNGSAGVFSLLLDGVTIDSHDFGIFPGGGTTLRSSLAQTVNLAARTYEFRVLVTRPFTVPDGLGQYLDNARFDPVLSTVPEPTSLAIFGIGACVAGLGAARRLRREKQKVATV